MYTESQFLQGILYTTPIRFKGDTLSLKLEREFFIIGWGLKVVKTLIDISKFAILFEILL